MEAISPSAKRSQKHLSSPSNTQSFSQSRSSSFQTNKLIKSIGSKKPSEKRVRINTNKKKSNDTSLIDTEKVLGKALNPPLESIYFYDIKINTPKQMKFLLKNTSGIPTSFKFFAEKYEPVSHKDNAFEKEVEKMKALQNLVLNNVKILTGQTGFSASAKSILISLKQYKFKK